MTGLDNATEALNQGFLTHPNPINSFISPTPYKHIPISPLHTEHHLNWVEKMASLTVSSPCKLYSPSCSLAGMKASPKPSAAQQNRVVRMPVKAASNASIEVVEKKENKEAMQRRSVMFAAAAAAAASAVSQGMIAMAGEPKNGSTEAKKLYARICVTMPTAKVCHN